VIICIIQIHTNEEYQSIETDDDASLLAKPL